MAPSEPLPPLYAILDPELTGNRSSADVLLQIVQGGAKLVQLRAKRLSSREFLGLAREIIPVMRSFGCRLIINDRVDIALACGADGVHLGQDDLPLAAAKKIMSNGIVGISTHDAGAGARSGTRRRRLYRIRPHVRHQDQGDRLQRARGRDAP